MDDIVTKKFNKDELLERFSQVIDKANEFIDKEDVQKVKKLFLNSNMNKAERMVAIVEMTNLQEKYVQFGDRQTQTALMMAVIGNTII